MSPTTTTTNKSHYTLARPAPRPASPLYTSPTQKKTMSITQSYYLAHKARAKLSSEAARPDHNLRLLVGHANLLDSLMLDLAEAEREQESWFNQSVRGASTSSSKADENQHVRWADTVVEEPEEDWEPEDASSTDSDSDSDLYSSDSSDDEYDDEGDVEMADAVPLRRVASHSNSYLYNGKPIANVDYAAHEEAVEFEDDEEEDYNQLTLTRSRSHSQSPPTPELDEDDESEDEDIMMPPSPPNPVAHEFTEKEREAIATTGFYQTSSKPQQPSQNKDFYDQGFYLPERNPARLVSAVSVY